MNQLQTFNHQMFGELPVVVVDGKEYFGATDVAKALEYKQPHTAVVNHCDAEGVITYNVLTQGGSQQKRFITLGNVSRLIVSASKQSKNPEIQQKAKIYEKWIFDDVIPSIHTQGGYIATNEDDDESTIMARALLIANKTIERKQRENEALHRQIEADAPFTKFGRVVGLSDGAITIGTYAKMIYEKHGVNIGRNKLMAWLRDNGYLIRQKGSEWNLPKQKYIENGWFKVRPALVARTDGDMEKGTPLITGKGQVALTNILLNEFSNKAI